MSSRRRYSLAGRIVTRPGRLLTLGNRSNEIMVDQYSKQAGYDSMRSFVLALVSQCIRIGFHKVSIR